MKPKEIVQHIMESFIPTADDLRKQNITDHAQWGGKLLAGMNNLDPSWDLSPSKRPRDPDCGEWDFEMTWAEDGGPVHNNKENSRAAITLRICKPNDSSEHNDDGPVMPIRPFSESKPGDSYTLVVRYTSNDVKGFCLEYRVFEVDDANNSICTERGRLDHD